MAKRNYISMHKRQDKSVAPLPGGEKTSTEDLNGPYREATPSSRDPSPDMVGKKCKFWRGNPRNLLVTIAGCFNNRKNFVITNKAQAGKTQAKYVESSLMNKVTR
jgi:hypothetical protein